MYNSQRDSWTGRLTQIDDWCNSKRASRFHRSINRPGIIHEMYVLLKVHVQDCIQGLAFTKLLTLDIFARL